MTGLTSLVIEPLPQVRGRTVGSIAPSGSPWQLHACDLPLLRLSSSNSGVVFTALVLPVQPPSQEPALHHPEYVQRMGLRASALPHLCALRSLRHLSFHLEERLGSGAPGSPLTELGALTALTCLELHGVAVGTAQRVMRYALGTRSFTACGAYCKPKDLSGAMLSK